MPKAPLPTRIEPAIVGGPLGGAVTVPLGAGGGTTAAGDSVVRVVAVVDVCVRRRYTLAPARATIAAITAATTHGRLARLTFPSTNWNVLRGNACCAFSVGSMTVWAWTVGSGRRIGIVIASRAARAISTGVA